MSALQAPETAASGGFFPRGLPSPAASTTSPTSSHRGARRLPHPRTKALPAGSRKEDLVRRYAEQRLAHISRRFVKKFGIAEPGDDVVGYHNFAELCRESEEVVDVLWLSGTPTLQIPFLLTLAGDLTQYVDSFPPSPKATFALLRKLDHCFASILCGRDIGTGEALPGFGKGLRAGMTVTDMVRCRSTVEHSRILIAEVMGKVVGTGDEDDEDSDADDDADDETSQRGGYDDDDDDDDDEMMTDVGRVYQRTLERLGERMNTGLSGTPALEMAV